MRILIKRISSGKHPEIQARHCDPEASPEIRPEAG
jgi:hypothetical protein